MILFKLIMIYKYINKYQFLKLFIFQVLTVNFHSQKKEIQNHLISWKPTLFLTDMLYLLNIDMIFVCCLKSAIDDIHVICGCLKDFFRSLREPMVTFALWQEFVSAAGKTTIAHQLSSNCLNYYDLWWHIMITLIVGTWFIDWL